MCRSVFIYTDTVLQQNSINIYKSSLSLIQYQRTWAFSKVRTHERIDLQDELVNSR